jgi:hypothetical protein
MGCADMLGGASDQSPTCSVTTATVSHVPATSQPLVGAEQIRMKSCCPHRVPCARGDSRTLISKQMERFPFLAKFDLRSRLLMMSSCLPDRRWTTITRGPMRLYGSVGCKANTPDGLAAVDACWSRFLQVGGGACAAGGMLPLILPCTANTRAHLVLLLHTLESG